MAKGRDDFALDFFQSIFIFTRRIYEVKFLPYFFGSVSYLCTYSPPCSIQLIAAFKIYFQQIAD